MRACVLFLLLAATPAWADDGLRCGAQLVSAGEHTGDVLAKCGPPTRAERRRSRRQLRAQTWSCVVEVWTYDRGPNDFVRTLTFTDDVLTQVDAGDYGH
jgi:hypothetical protein